MTTITVHTDKPGAEINRAMWGIFFEDINLGADGGLYAELVKNGSFAFPDGLMGWFEISPSLAKGELSLRADEPANLARPNHLRISSRAIAPFGACNEGFRGMGVRAGESYDLSARIRRVEGSPRVIVELVGSDGTTLGVRRLEGIGSSWTEVRATLLPNDTDARARLNVLLEGGGTIDIDQVSLFPRNTWKQRPGGLRADMVQMLADLQPGFLRFPGGCIVEGSDLSKRYQWKTTIGPVAERKLIVNRWNYEFKHRPTPDYFQSFGLGFFELFQLSEDIGAEPLPILNCGMACQFNSGELVPLEELDPFVQDALDLIEFANGPATSPWGAKRAAMGHPASFEMKMLGIGNEQWGPQYIERLAVFTKAIRARHPEIKLIADAGPSPQDERFCSLWPKLRELKMDVVDEHCYANPSWFLANSDRYDEYDRQGPKIFFGEYAAQSVAICSTKNRNNLECAIAEAAFMTGLERNADIVCMASYAPLFAHVEGWQWTPDLIWTDNLRAHGTPSYYVQQLFCRHRGDRVLPVSNDSPVQKVLPSGRIGLGTLQASAEFKEVRVMRGGKTLFASDLTTSADGWTAEGDWRVKDGAYQQPDPRATATASAGETFWTDYTLTLEARKLDGAEGIVITVLDDGAGAWATWSLGGWGNQFHSIQSHYAEQDQFLGRVPGSLETGRWYEIRIVVQGSRIECSLDGRVIQSAEVLLRRVPALFASATHDLKAGEVILKLVNPGRSSCETSIRLAGIERVRPGAQAFLLTGHPEDVNSLDQPCKVAMREVAVAIQSPGFEQTVPANAMLLLRVPVE